MSNTKDLGTYHLRVEFEGGDGYIQKWTTGNRYTNGTNEVTLLTATHIHPTWISEEDLFETMVYMYLDGNYSCDCNRSLFLARSKQQEDPDVECGDTLKLKSLIAIRPDMSEKVLFQE